MIIIYLGSNIIRFGFQCFHLGLSWIWKITPSGSTFISGLDVRCAVCFDAAKEAAPDQSKIIIYAMSVGGFPAGEMMGKRDLVPIFLRRLSPPLQKKIEDNMSLSLPGGFLTSGVLETDVKLENTTTPTLIMHGTNDDRISLRSAESFYDGLPDDLVKQLSIIEGAGHGLGGDGGVPDASYQTYRDTMLNFLRDSAPACLE